MQKKKVALLGDSIFDNEVYVARGESVIEQIGKINKKDWHAELLALDGAITRDIAWQCAQVGHDITHIFVSCGGNDALGYINVFGEKCSSMIEAMHKLTEIKLQFQGFYQEMLDKILKLNKKLSLCTIYDSSPEIEEELLTALTIFNDIIFKEAFKLGIPVIDLRLIFDQPADYSSVSTIEPSEIGGKKIAKAIAYVVENHDFNTKNSVIYSTGL